MAKRRIETDPTKRPDYVARGSEAHKALLEMVDGAMTEEEAADRREKALKAKPVPSASDERKLPVTRDNYERFEPIIDGWARKSQ